MKAMSNFASSLYVLFILLLYIQYFIFPLSSKAIPMLSISLNMDQHQYLRRLLASIDYEIKYICIQIGNHDNKVIQRIIEDIQLERLAQGYHEMNILISTVDYNPGSAKGFNFGLYNMMYHENDISWVFIVNNDIAFYPNQLKQLSQYVETSLINDNTFGIGFTGLCCGGEWSAIIITKKLVESIGYFDENIYPAYYEDDDYAIRIRQTNFYKAKVFSDIYLLHGEINGSLDYLSGVYGSLYSKQAYKVKDESIEAWRKVHIQGIQYSKQYIEMKWNISLGHFDDQIKSDCKSPKSINCEVHTCLIGNQLPFNNSDYTLSYWELNHTNIQYLIDLGKTSQGLKNIPDFDVGHNDKTNRISPKMRIPQSFDSMNESEVVEVEDYKRLVKQPIPYVMLICPLIDSSCYTSLIQLFHKNDYPITILHILIANSYPLDVLKEETRVLYQNITQSFVHVSKVYITNTNTNTNTSMKIFKSYHLNLGLREFYHLKDTRNMNWILLIDMCHIMPSSISLQSNSLRKISRYVERFLLFDSQFGLAKVEGLNDIIVMTRRLIHSIGVLDENLNDETTWDEYFHRMNKSCLFHTNTLIPMDYKLINEMLPPSSSYPSSSTSSDYLQLKWGKDQKYSFPFNNSKVPLSFWIMNSSLINDFLSIRLISFYSHEIAQSQVALDDLTKKDLQDLFLNDFPMILLLPRLTTTTSSSLLNTINSIDYHVNMLITCNTTNNNNNTLRDINNIHYINNIIAFPINCLYHGITLWKHSSSLSSWMMISYEDCIFPKNILKKLSRWIERTMFFDPFLIASYSLNEQCDVVFMTTSLAYNYDINNNITIEDLLQSHDLRKINELI